MRAARSRALDSTAGPRLARESGFDAGRGIMRRRPWIPVLAGAVTILAATLAPIASSSARADQVDANVKAWIEINTTRPAVGCEVTFAVEIRSNGDPIIGDFVSAALFSGSDPIDVDKETTDNGGVVHLTVDTSSGVGDWVDINVNGGFLTGFAIAAGKGSSCDDSPRSVEVSGAVTVDTSNNASADSSSGAS